MKQLESKLQQKNAIFSVGYNINCEEFGPNHETWEQKLDPWVRRMREEMGSVIHEQLQKFAKMLSKKYQVDFPTEFFNKSHQEPQSNQPSNPKIGQPEDNTTTRMDDLD